MLSFPFDISFDKNQVTVYIEYLLEAEVAAQSIFWVANRKSRLNSFEEKGGKPQLTDGNISFSNVTFFYQSRDVPVLTGKHTFSIFSYFFASQLMCN